jgi:hypothetical protein
MEIIEDILINVSLIPFSVDIFSACVCVCVCVCVFMFAMRVLSCMFFFAHS